MNFLPAQFEPKCEDEDSPHLVLPRLIILLRSLRLLRLYIKMPFQEPTTKSPWIYHQHGRFYIGSTSIGASKREFNRMAKLRQIRHKMPVSTELALQYWARRSDFEMFTILVLKSFDTYAKAWTFEHLLISHWQPPLNRPFITKPVDGCSRCSTIIRIFLLFPWEIGCFFVFVDDSVHWAQFLLFILFKLKLGRHCSV